ncbi:sugar O-acetyltransferase [Desertivirga brevis]|uniref:sugar O-acetyltransferase n=1 Tax=Desertivirga brevis TaxID=2810310 RepID=UPI001A974CC8|nr:sugar O-acetyltransferase [Pedobacter sp. SYSU D00873]
MKSEREKMLAQELYYINDPELVEIRYKTRELVDEFNATGPRDVKEKEALQRRIFGSVGENVHIEKPIRIDYGINTRIGSNVFINFNFVMLDCCPVTIGNNVFIAPNVQIYTAKHPIDPETRNKHIGSALPITIGNDVWIGGNCVILPGVTIGDGCTIGAGSLVSKSIPPNSIAVGSPCRVVKHL